MSVCVKIVIKMEIGKINQEIVIGFFCPHRTAINKTNKNNPVGEKQTGKQDKAGQGRAGQGRTQDV